MEGRKRRGGRRAWTGWVSVLVLHTWAEGVDDDGVKEADEEEQIGGVMGEGPKARTAGNEGGGRAMLGLTVHSICCYFLVSWPSSFTCWWWSFPPRSRHLSSPTTSALPLLLLRGLVLVWRGWLEEG